MVLSTQGLTGS